MSASTVSVELNYDYQSAHRFPAWLALSVFSAVCLAAVATQVDSRGGAEKWVLSVTIVSMILSFLAVVAYLVMRAPFVGQLPEGALLGLLTALWCAGLPTIMNPNRDLAVISDEEDLLVIKNANLYFFCWLSLACILYLSGSFAQEAAGYDVTKTPPKTARWYGLCASSVVVLGSAVEALKSADACDIEGLSKSTYCRRTRWAISLGTISAVVAGAVVFMSRRGQLQLAVEFGITTLLLILWCFGVGFITFGSTPGATISNLYFASWISFILAVYIFAQSFREVLAARYDAHAPSQQHDGQQEAEQDVGANPVVNIDENNNHLEDL